VLTLIAFTPISQVLEYIPPRLRELLATAPRLLPDNAVQEIRFRTNRPLCVCVNGVTRYITENGGLSFDKSTGKIIAQQDVTALFQSICGHSVYAYLEEIKQGFITLKGGHRAGICGRAVVRGGVIENIKDISGINLRIAHQIIGAADGIIGKIVSRNGERATAHSTLIISPPQCGKTTMLRDIARQCSNMGLNVAIADERGEIGACVNGAAQNDLGANTDILDGCPKAEGMTMLLRSMSPQVLVTDEIAAEADVAAVQTAMLGGVAVMASVHGASVRDIMESGRYSPLFRFGFEYVVLLSMRNGAGTVEEIINVGAVVLDRPSNEEKTPRATGDDRPYTKQRRVVA